VFLSPGDQRLDLGQLLLGDIARAAGQPAPGRDRVAPPDLAGQQAVGQREVTALIDELEEGR
jgi:hypothetical protein